MICKNCCEAADAEQKSDFVKPVPGVALIVLRSHGRCTGCDCQHKPVGSYTAPRDSHE